ncbi:TonB-dependent receptor [Fulvivirgaceae bacterium BMA12]|uniref:TonB-dependent receptor n=1 Tax=Agaribacillus aureus TaxID=3051825 RepID=A0ABT8LEN1_9BACT|nr:TonB-dependent receptor [Fulvivirgaceae bacterium BMA12]
MREHFTKLVKRGGILGLFLMLMTVGVQHLYAQQKVTGQVTDENDQGIPGVNILIQGTTAGVVTDATGNYSIQASQDDILVISFVGYLTENITVGSQTTINVQLVPDIQNLEEIVVIGYGTTKKSDLTGSVAQVNAESFKDQPLTRVEDALQGRAAGVTVARANGAPGAAVKVRIRGANSITGNNDPLVVIDGIIGGDLTTLNPNDIASMDVLKDASATAIYGSRGSNGVILVTTKQGTGQSKVDIDYFTSFSKVPELLPTLGAADFARIENSRRIRTGGSAIFTDQEISALEASGGTNYQDEFLQSALSHNLQISASGSEGKLNYFVSGNYVDQEGIVIETGYERYSLRSNINTQVTDKLNVGLNLYGSRATTLNDLNAFGRFQGSDIVKALTWDPTTPVRDANGAYNNFSIKGLASLNYNPIANLEQSVVENISDRLNANLNVSYDIIDNLNYTLVAGVGTINSATETYRTDPPFPDASFWSNKITTHQISNILTWQKDFNEHDLKITGIYEFSGRQDRRNSYNAANLAVPAGFFLAETAPGSGQSIGNDLTPSTIQSYMGRGEYNYNNTIYLTATIRVDQSSVFRPDNRTGTFPSVALAYNFGNAPFFNGGSIVSDLKVRAGWGQVGNQNIDPFSTFASVKANSSFAFNGATATPGSSPDGFANPELTWETTTQTNVGVDLSLFDGRASLSIDGYKKNTTDLLLETPIPDTNGGGTILKNVGEVENTGIDVVLSAAVINKDKLSWDVNFNLSHYKNEVVDLGGVEEIQGSFGSTDGQSRAWNVIQLGEPLGQFQGSTFLGTWKTAEAAEALTFGRIPGDAKYLRDESGNRVIGAIGNGTPTLLWGFNNTLSYGDWDLNVFLQGVHGFDVYNTVQGMIVGATGNHRSFLAVEQLNQWTAENETEIPAGGENDAGSTRYVEDGSFIRLSNLTLGYTLRDVIGLKTVKFYVGGQNLFLITDYSGYDPEHTSRPANSATEGNVDEAAGINAGAYPNPRTFTVGLKVGF